MGNMGAGLSTPERLNISVCENAPYNRQLAMAGPPIDIPSPIPKLIDLKCDRRVLAMAGSGEPKGIG